MKFQGKERKRKERGREREWEETSETGGVAPRSIFIVAIWYCFDGISQVTVLNWTSTKQQVLVLPIWIDCFFIFFVALFSLWSRPQRESGGRSEIEWAFCMTTRMWCLSGKPRSLASPPRLPSTARTSLGWGVICVGLYCSLG